MTLPATGSAPPAKGGCLRGLIFTPNPVFSVFLFFWVFEMQIFTSFLCSFFNKKTPFSCWKPEILKKMRVQTSWNFSKAGRRRADIGQSRATSGAGHRANVGQTSGKRRASSANFWNLQISKKRTTKTFWSAGGQKF